ncbi:unnamed protein product [Diabrotica balteata]|uniref:PAZ domain-containing protein n=1 Tax=Diabrotica balteata TaxID=107213 RepID=A0A9N9SSP7_DIABA|nr:unnamed protein product [Diabrotica balteata]
MRKLQEFCKRFLRCPEAVAEFRKLQLTLLQRDYYDPKSQINIQEHKLSLWPGYFTSIQQHENQVMMNIELAFKVLREDTCYNMFLEIRCPEPRNEFLIKIIGSSVLTFYNNRTYRIDDIDFSQNADSTLTLVDGSQIIYAQYYADKYKTHIRERRQPLLNCGNSQLAISDHTRVGPVDRMRKLQDFCKRFLRCPEAVAELRKLQLTLLQRDYYDPKSQINIHEHKLPLWPGYFTSIQQHENQVMMNIELAFKVLREDTCYNMFLEIRGPEPRKEFLSKIIGSSVLTFYNNRT